MRLVFAGTPEPALPSLDAIEGSGHELVAVLTRPDAPAGRNRRPQRSPVGPGADERGIEVLTPGHPREQSFVERLEPLHKGLFARVTWRENLDAPLVGPGADG